jgi:enterochelin esterase-like enzyme
MRVTSFRRPHVQPLQGGLGGFAFTPAAEGERDLRLDFLRGFAVFAMVVDHLAGPSPLEWVTGGNRFFTSAAEGFVFLSGLVVGLVYRRLIARQGLGLALRRLVERAWALYVLAVGMTLVMLPVSEVLNLPWARGVDLRQPANLLWQVAILHQTAYLVDVPLLYALLLIAAPVALLLLHERRTAVVLLASWLLWAGYQLFPEQTILPWPIAGNYLFQFAAWQVLFFTAMVLGFHQDRVARFVPVAARRPLLLASGLGTLLLVLLYLQLAPALHDVAGATSGGSTNPLTDLADLLFSKGDLRPGRILASAVVFTFLFLLVSELWVPLRRILGWLLLPLGTNALYAYSLHVALALGLGILTMRAGITLPDTPWGNLAVQVLGVAVVWLFVRGRILLPTRATRGWWLASPVALAGALLVGLPLVPAPAVVVPEAAPSESDLAAARAVRRFGTPMPREQALAIATGDRSFLLTPEPQATATDPAAPAPVAGVPPPSDLPAVERAAAPDVLGQSVGPIQGTLREATFYSAALGQEMPYYVYLPPDYATEPRRYSVLYMLHGIGGHRDEWVYYGLINELDRQIVAGEIRPLLVVLPQGDTSYWVNQVDGLPWADYVSDDLVRHIDATYPTEADAAHRALGGLSNGARAALQIGFTHPHEFGVIGAHSPSLHRDDGSLPILGTGDDFDARDPISLVWTADDLEDLTIWIDSGADDPWLGRATELHEDLLWRGVVHRWNVLEGGHESEYWEEHLPLYLHFYDAALP